MENNKRIAELLVKTKAFRDLENPVILASGELGIYFINTEKLSQDGGKFAEYGNSSKDMIAHLNKMMEEHPEFEEVIDIMCEKVKSALEELPEPYAIAGGQRRDWVFSGPVAKKLNLPHISLYKQEENKNDKLEALMPDGSISEKTSGYSVVHVVDLVTEASSVYREVNGKELGWIPMLRNAGNKISNLFSVVTRLQGGEERVKKQGVTITSFVGIDSSFLKEYSQNAEEAVEYTADPSAWSKNYLKENGALSFIDTFDPVNGKPDKVKAFMDRYGEYLKDVGKFDEFAGAVKEKFNYDI